jgi:cell division protein FtsQ
MTKNFNSIELPVDIKFINGLSNVLFCLFAFLVMGNIVQYLVKNKINNLSGIVVKGNVIHNDIMSIRNEIGAKILGNFYNIDLIKTKQTFESMAWVNQAVVRRVYPSQIEVRLSEYKPKAIWGSRDDFKLVDENGIVFEVTFEDEEQDELPQFIGSEGQSKAILDMHKELVPLFTSLKYQITGLELNARGSWIATLGGGARIELGRGNSVEVIGRAQKFVNGAELMLEKLNKKIADVEYIDLRHTDGYAIRLRGVTTMDLSTANTFIKK